MHDWKQYVRQRVAELKLHPAREAEIVEELAQHLGDVYDEACTAGGSEEEALRQALDELSTGALAKELLRAERPALEPMPPVEGRRGNMLGTVWQDVRYGLRVLRKNPGFTLVAVLTLALGIGACTALFSVVYGVLLRPLPYPKPDQVVQVIQIGERGNQMNTSDPNFEDWHEQNRTFAGMAQYASWTASVTGGSEPVRESVAPVSKDFFTVFGVAPAYGRAFLPEEQREGGSPVVVVSYAYWQRYLGGDPNFAAKRLTLAGFACTVVGVMPPEFSFPPGTQMWVPRELLPRYPSRTAHNWKVAGRLKDGVTLAEARAEMSAIGKRMKQQYGDDVWLSDVAVVPMQEQLTGRARPALLVLLGAVGFLLLIACANVVNLLLARTASRQRELAVRVALGAGRGRLVQQFLTESLLLTLAGSALGVLASVWGVGLLLAFEPGNLPRRGEIGVNGVVLAFALGTSVLTAAALGLVTALRSTGADLQGALKESQRTQTGAGHRLRGALVVSQVAMTLVLLVGAALLGRSFLQLLAVDPGFRTRGAVVMELSHPDPKGDDGLARLARLHQELLRRLQAVPGVEEVGGVSLFPMSGDAGNGTFIILSRPDEVRNFDDFGRLAKLPERSGDAEYRVASEGYFTLMGIPLLRGRLFDERDGPDAPHVAVISESLWKTRWLGEDPLGKLIQFGNMDGDLRPFTIVGVVGDIHERGLDASPRPTFYGNYRQRPAGTQSFSLVLRGAAPEAAVVSAARSILSELAPNVPPRFRTVEEVLSTSLSDRRFSLLLLGIFGGMALLLAVMGVYGVMSYSVAQRSQEIGIRVALGAQSRDVLGMVLGEGSRLVLGGVVLGALGAFWLTRLMRTLLFGVSPTDPMSFGLVAALLVLVALAACWVPARRATRVDPMVALRHE